MNPENPFQPYLDYDISKLNSFLNTFLLPVEPGVASNYSNLSAGIAGYGLELIYNTTLENILRTAFLDDFKMDDTRIHFTSEQIARTAPVFLNGEKIEPWKFENSSILKGAGALRSTIHDMLVLLKAMMGQIETDHMPMIKLATTPTFSKSETLELGLFWHIHKSTYTRIIWHNGGTYGSSSFFGYDDDAKIGIVALSNSQIFDDLGNPDSRLTIQSISTIKSLRTSFKTENH